MKPSRRATAIQPMPQPLGFQVSSSRRLSGPGPLLVFLVMAGRLAAQQPQPLSPPAPASRLEQLESTYHLNLRRYHAPILQDYLAQLETLKQKLNTQRRPADAGQVDKEILHVKNLIATTGIFPYTSINPSSPLAATEPGSEQRRRHTLALHAADAVSPAPITTEAREALPLGSIAWNIPKLPAGAYDVLMVYTAATLAQPEPILLTLDDQQLISTLPVSRATGNNEAYRAFKLGRLTLNNPVNNRIIAIQNGNPAVPSLRLRNLLLVRAQED